MNITVPVSAYYEWESVPADVQVAKKDVTSGRVKPSQNGGWLMRVEKKLPTTVTFNVPEGEIIETIIHDAHAEGCSRTRWEAASLYVSRHQAKHAAHQKWMKDFVVDDDAPDPKLFAAMVQPHVDCGNISEDLYPELLEAYLQEAHKDHKSDHFHAHFKVPKPQRDKPAASAEPKPEGAS